MMRTITITIISLFITMTAWSQGNVPFGEGFMEWNIQEIPVNPEWDQLTKNYFTTEADSLIEGTTYRLVWEYRESDDAFFTVGGFRETDDQEVFLYWFSGNFESLLYDFGAEVGDRVTTNWKNQTVTAVDQVIINGVDRKRLTIDDGSTEDTVYWIEGIGSNKGLIYPWQSENDYQFTLGCVHQSGVNIYEDDVVFCSQFPDLEEIFNLATSNDLEIANAQTIQILPIPLVDASTIQVTGLDAGIYELSIFNILGQEMETVQFENELTKEIFRADFREGIYIYTVNSLERNVFTGKFMVE